MRKWQVQKWGLFLLVCIVIGWPLVQLMKSNSGHKEEIDAAHALIQVAAFQMEWLNRVSQDAAQAEQTDDLADLKQAVYAAQFTHQRLVRADGKHQVKDMASLNDLQQYVMRLQIGGNRKLSDTEKSSLQEIRKYVQQLLDTYEKLTSPVSGSMLNSSVENLDKKDLEFSAYLRKIMT